MVVDATGTLVLPLRLSVGAFLDGLPACFALPVSTITVRSCKSNPFAPNKRALDREADRTMLSANPPREIINLIQVTGLIWRSFFPLWHSRYLSSAVEASNCEVERRTDDLTHASRSETRTARADRAARIRVQCRTPGVAQVSAQTRRADAATSFCVSSFSISPHATNRGYLEQTRPACEGLAVFAKCFRQISTATLLQHIFC